MNEAASGRPVRFFALVMLGWVAARFIGTQIDATETEKTVEPPIGTPHYTTARRYHNSPPASLPRKARFRETALPVVALPLPSSRHLLSRERGSTGQMPPTPVPAAKPSAFAIVGPVTGNDRTTPINPAPALPPASLSRTSIDRWHGSAWALWRDGSASPSDAIAGGRLGGSQAGVRLDFDLTPQARGRTTLYGRASAALNQPASPEAAIGLAWQPERSVPVSLAAERRIALGKGARNANALMAVGGFGPAKIAADLEIEAYAQTGMVGFRSRDFFADGKLSLLSPVGQAPLRLGASLSGGAQPKVERLDIGPELQVRLPTAPVAARLAIEWRERIAGNASPPSGLAVTLGADF